MNLFRRLFDREPPADEERRIVLGDRAREVLAQDAVQQALADMRFACHEGFRSAPADAQALLDLRHRLSLIDQFEAQLEMYVADSELERAGLEERERLEGRNAWAA